jgi:hypothetical protein
MLQVRDRTAELLDSVRLSDPIEPLPAIIDEDEGGLSTSQG